MAGEALSSPPTRWLGWHAVLPAHREKEEGEMRPRLRVPALCLAAFLLALPMSSGAALGRTIGSTKGVIAKPSDFNGDGYADLAVGVPGEDVGSATDRGA